MKSQSLEIIKDCLLAIKRKDKRANISLFEFVVGLIFSFAVDQGKRTLTSLRRDVTDLIEKKLSRGGFWERLATKRLL